MNSFKKYSTLLREEQRRSDEHAIKIWERTEKAYGINYIYDFQNTKILKKIDFKKKFKLLEVGCGIGNFLKAAVSITTNIYGIDLGIYNSRQAHLNTGYQAKISVADGKYLPFKPESFDYVVAKGIIHHLVDSKGVFEGIKKVLKPGSKLVILEGDPSAMYRKLVLGIADVIGIEHEVTQFRHLTAKEIEHILYNVGFKKIRIQKIAHPFIPIGLQGVGNRKFWTFLDRVADILKTLPFNWYLLITAEI